MDDSADTAYNHILFSTSAALAEVIDTHVVRRYLRDHDERDWSDADGEGSGQDVKTGSSGSQKSGGRTYAINAITAILASVTAPLSKPTPTPTRERMAPVADKDNSFFLPKRYAAICEPPCHYWAARNTHINEDDRSERHEHVHDGDSKRYVRA